MQIILNVQRFRIVYIFIDNLIILVQRLFLQNLTLFDYLKNNYQHS